MEHACTHGACASLLAQIGMDYADYRCLNFSNFDTTDEESSWTKSSSPWSTPQECWWPLDSEDTRLCAFDSSSGNHKCEHDPLYMNESEFRWCGSNYDALGNGRFAGGVIEGVEWSAADLSANATFLEDLAWGYTNFDNIFVAFLTIFQSITLEGWSDVLYQVGAWRAGSVCAAVTGRRSPSPWTIIFVKGLDSRQRRWRRRRRLVAVVVLLRMVAVSLTAVWTVCCGQG